MGTHLAELPPAVTALLDTARAAAAAGDRPRTTKALFEALSAVGFPSTYPDVIYPLPETLTPVQRRLAELIAQMDVFAPWERMPSGATARRWLGLEAPGPLETLVDHEGTRLPLWRVLALGGGRSGVLEVIASLPLPLRLDVLATLGGEAWAYRIDSDAPGAWRVVSSLAGEGRDWALARLAAAPPKALAEVHAEAVIGEQLAFFALVRGGHPIEPAWDLYLPIGTPVPPAIAAECARALPLDRLKRVAPTLLEKTFGPVAIQTGLAILAHHDSPAIAQFVWTKSERSFPHHRAAERKALLALAETLPAALAALALLRGKAPKPRTLTVTARLAPRSEAELSTLQAAQLVQAGRAWDRQTQPASRRLSCDENDEAALGAVLEHLTIAEHGKPAFEAWLYQGDSGTFFEAGTTNVIAHRIQCAIELVGKKKDPALKDALGRFSESKNASPAPRRRARRDPRRARGEKERAEHGCRCGRSRRNEGAHRDEACCDEEHCEEGHCDEEHCDEEHCDEEHCDDEGRRDEEHCREERGEEGALIDAGYEPRFFVVRRMSWARRSTAGGSARPRRQTRRYGTVPSSRAGRRTRPSVGVA